MQDLAIKKRVTVGIMGGLGNQMFQFAAGYALSQMREAQLTLDISHFNTLPNQKYMLDLFGIPASVGCDIPPKRRKFIDRILKKSEKSCFFKERNFHYNSSLPHIPADHLYLLGYFQSPRYFENYIAEIRKIFKLPRSERGIIARQRDQIKEIPIAISVHIRRGDYYTNPEARKVHNLLPIGYYERAITLMQRLHGKDAAFYFFSDDPDYVSEKFSGINNAFFIESDLSSPVEDMQLMSECNHHIIANSSFSWWAAWLNPEKNKDVIAPAHWFTPEKLSATNVTDLYDEKWIILK